MLMKVIPDSAAVERWCDRVFGLSVLFDDIGMVVLIDKDGGTFAFLLCLIFGTRVLIEVAFVECGGI